MTDAGVWFACEHPERPPDAHTLWHFGDCRPCELAATAAYMHDGSDARYNICEVQRITPGKARGFVGISEDGNVVVIQNGSGVIEGGEFRTPVGPAYGAHWGIR